MFWWCGAGGDGIWICGAMREAEGGDWGDGSGRAGVCAGVGGGGRESVGLGLEGSACGGRRSECLLCPVRVRRAGERRGVPGVRKSARRKGDGGGCSRPAMVGGGRWAVALAVAVAMGLALARGGMWAVWAEGDGRCQARKPVWWLEAHLRWGGGMRSAKATGELSLRSRKGSVGDADTLSLARLLMR